MGVIEGEKLGELVGESTGWEEGLPVGLPAGEVEGELVGELVGNNVGEATGELVGARVGIVPSKTSWPKSYKAMTSSCPLDGRVVQGSQICKIQIPSNNKLLNALKGSPGSDSTLFRAAFAKHDGPKYV